MKLALVLFAALAAVVCASEAEQLAALPLGEQKVGEHAVDASHVEAVQAEAVQADAVQADAEAVQAEAVQAEDLSKGAIAIEAVSEASAQIAAEQPALLQAAVMMNGGMGDLMAEKKQDEMLKAANDLDELLDRLENDEGLQALTNELDALEILPSNQQVAQPAAQESAQQPPSQAAQEPEERAFDEEFPLFDDLELEAFDDEDDSLFENSMQMLEELEERADPTDGYEIDGAGGDGLNDWGGVYNVTVPLVAGDGWVEFLFNGTGTNVTSTFLAFSADQALVLYLTDVGCSGDQFAIYDNDVLIGSSSVPTVNNCTTVISDATTAYSAPGYSTFSAVLAAGVNHVITLVMLASPYGGGTGAIQVNFDLNTCTVAGTGITIITDPLPHNETEIACEGIGMRALDVTIYNFPNATTVLFDCLGAYAHAYIGSYWGNTYMDSPLALWVSWILPGGAIAPTLSGDLPLPIMCQAATYFTTFSDSD